MMKKTNERKMELKMKKLLAIFLVATMMFSLVACGTKNGNQLNTPEGTSKEASKEASKEVSKEVSNVTSTLHNIPGREYDESDPTAVLGEITNDFDDIITQLTKKQTETFSAVGTTFEDYQKNKVLVDEWIALVLSESDALFARTKENSIAYFKLIAAHEDHKYNEFCDEALDKYYDIVYDDAMDEYYDSIYDDAMDELYDEYYDGIIEDAYDDLEYKEWSNVSSESYKTWSNASADIYKKWSGESSYLYGLWSSMSTAFCYKNNFDVDSIVSEYDKKKAEEAAEREASENSSDLNDELSEKETIQESTVESTVSVEENVGSNIVDEIDKTIESKNPDDITEDIRKEFKEAMDSYEAFYAEYFELLKEYKENPTDINIMKKYSDMFTKVEEMDEAFNEWNEEDLNKEELKYYMDVNNRVMKMFVDIAE